MSQVQSRAWGPDANPGQGSSYSMERLWNPVQSEGSPSDQRGHWPNGNSVNSRGFLPLLCCPLLESGCKDYTGLGGPQRTIQSTR